MYKVVLVSDIQQSDSVIHIHKFTLFQVLVPYRFVVIHTVIGEGNGTPLQYSCLENPMDGGAW